jgi:hypothetical protein
MGNPEEIAAALVWLCSVAAASAEHGRNLATAERDGLAKLALFQAFDERPGPSQLSEPAELRAADVQAIAQVLDL